MPLWNKNRFYWINILISCLGPWWGKGRIFKRETEDVANSSLHEQTGAITIVESTWKSSSSQDSGWDFLHHSSAGQTRKLQNRCSNQLSSHLGSRADRRRRCPQQALRREQYRQLISWEPMLLERIVTEICWRCYILSHPIEQLQTERLKAISAIGMGSPDKTEQESHSRWDTNSAGYTGDGQWGNQGRGSGTYSHPAKLIICCLVRRDGELIPN